MTNFTLLLHLLAAACLIGMYIPELLLKFAYNKSGDAQDSKLAIAAVHVRMMLWFFPILLIAILLGVGRTFELHYPWFDFSLTLWLAIKQSLGLLMLIGYAAHLGALRKTSRALASADQSSDARLKNYESVRGKAHPFILLAWVMAIFGVLKI
jgi:hypothetical protein